MTDPIHGEVKPGSQPDVVFDFYTGKAGAQERPYGFDLAFVALKPRSYEGTGTVDGVPHRIISLDESDYVRGMLLVKVAPIS